MRRRQIQKMLDAAFAHSWGGPERRYLLGAIALRNDGALVRSRNSPCTQRTPEVHAEARLCTRLTPGTTVFVARAMRGIRCAGMAKPCTGCMNSMRSVGVSRVYFTTPEGYGWEDL